MDIWLFYYIHSRSFRRLGRTFVGNPDVLITGNPAVVSDIRPDTGAGYIKKAGFSASRISGATFFLNTFLSAGLLAGAAAAAAAAGAGGFHSFPVSS